MSSDALCIWAGMTPIIIKTEEAVKLYNIKEGSEIKNKLSTEKWSLKIGHNWQKRLQSLKGKNQITHILFIHGR